MADIPTVEEMATRLAGGDERKAKRILAPWHFWRAIAEIAERCPTLQTREGRRTLLHQALTYPNANWTPEEAQHLQEWLLGYDDAG